ncbi:MAG TPA: SRPBCC domain-containing protein [Candidatus Thermoplasmatota archaeon]|nr:SRPBCC domain-containing protein [Candidatus Thermoplasmatota archaeon]
MVEDIVHEATYPYPPAEVWRALTTREALNAWLMDSDFQEATVGHRFAFRDKPRIGWDGISRCEVLEVVPERKLVLAFGIEGDARSATKVHWELEPTADGGTRVRFRHSGFGGLKGWLMRAGMDQGWGGMVRHSIPYVLAQMRAGRVPTKDETTEVRKRGLRGDHQAQKARA